MPDRSRRRRPRWRRPLALGVGVAVVLVAAGGGVAWAMSTRSGDRYTTATVTMGSVQQTVSASGTVASSSRRDVAFPVAGTVASVAVGVGDTVTAGQVLASLDTDSLQDALDQANTALQEAQQTLSDDLESQTSSSSSSSSGTTTPGGSGSSGTGSSGAGPSGSSQPSGSSTPSAAVRQATADVQAKQQALMAAYRDAHDALQASSAALTQAQAVCADVAALDPDEVGSTPAPTDTSTTEPDPDETPTATPTATSPSVSDAQALIAACQAALGSAATAQDTTKTKQDAVSDAATALDQAVAALQQALGLSSDGDSGSGSSGANGTGGGPTVSGASYVVGTGSTVTLTAAVSGSGSSSGGSSGGLGAQTTVATAADILADEAAIDAAQAQVDIATKDLTLVDLTSPIAGTVGAVSITAGAQVSAQSTSAVITVLGTDGYLVDLTVPLSSVGKLAVGQPATVAVPSTAQQLTGTVSSIGVLDVSSTSTPEYDVVVAVDATTEKLFDGSSAQVQIAVADTGQVLTVPTSAVHVDGSTATVQVLADGQVSDVTVERGAVGTELTEITSGLTEGQTVVLADRDEPLETGSSSSSSSGLSGLTSGGTTQVGVGGGGAGFAPGGGTFPGRG